MAFIHESDIVPVGGSQWDILDDGGYDDYRIGCKEALDRNDAEMGAIANENAARRAEAVARFAADVAMGEEPARF